MYTEELVPQLVAGILAQLRERDPGVAEELQSLEIDAVMSTRRAGNVNAFSKQTERGTEIVVGRGLCTFLSQYAHAAATYFVSASPEGDRPSELWPAARASLSSTVEWLSSSSREPRSPSFEVTPHQAKIAEAFGVFALRFGLCHEIAHGLLGHEAVAVGQVGESADDRRAVLEFSHSQEIEADKVGLWLQLKSLPDPEQRVEAMSSASYMIHAVELLRLRLMLLTKLIDESRWETILSHPPYLHRMTSLAAAAEVMAPGAQAGLEYLRTQLYAFNGEVMSEATRQQERVSGAVNDLIGAEIQRGVGELDGGDLTLAAVRERLGLRLTDPVPSAAAEMLELLDPSPLGVLEVLDRRAMVPEAELPQPALVHLALIARLVAELPQEFGRFLGLSREQRTDVILGIPVS